jgi:general secretion pathway protein J
MFILSVLSLLGWRAMDTLMRTKEITQTHTQQNALIQVALAQWRADLMAIQPVTGMNDAGVSWDGRVLRLTRRSSALQADGSESGLWVVAWTLRTDSLQQASWTRWQSPPQTQLAALAQAWQQAQNWGHNEINDLPGQTSLIHE